MDSYYLKFVLTMNMIEWFVNHCYEILITITCLWTNERNIIGELQELDLLYQAVFSGVHLIYYLFKGSILVKFFT